ncbi:hypothetical protein P8452_35933 [Trifolium repens]|nr:hypothetical protein P8452_35933 [Trifolium repens]
MCIRRRTDAQRRRRCGVTLCDHMGFGHSSATILSLLGMHRLAKLLVEETLMMISFNTTLPNLNEWC